MKIKCIKIMTNITIMDDDYYNTNFFFKIILTHIFILQIIFK
jgi:hypothetical protein